MKFPSTPLYPSQRSAVMADNLVATSQPLASQAGVSMLARGGNAVDAALATAIALTVVEPTGCGLGSDAFAIVWDGQGLHGLNASGRSPASCRSPRSLSPPSLCARPAFRSLRSSPRPGAMVLLSWLTSPGSETTSCRAARPRCRASGLSTRI